MSEVTFVIFGQHQNFHQNNRLYTILVSKQRIYGNFPKKIQNATKKTKKKPENLNNICSQKKIKHFSVRSINF